MVLRTLYADLFTSLSGEFNSDVKITRRGYGS